MALSGKRLAQMATDKTGGAGEENVHIFSVGNR
jgi:hypothetical protein